MGKTKPNKRQNGTADALHSKKAAAKSKEVNPFEVHTNKEKFSILGRKLKHDKGMPGVSRAKATKKRKETLGQEYSQKDKTNKFKDKRVGKFGMSKEEVAGARFIAERLSQFKSKRQSLFNLNDDEVLTHKGQTLEEIEQFQDTISDDDDDEEIGKLDAEFTGAAHFGGNDLEDGRNRKSAIDELIAETKRRKAEVSKEKEEVSALTQRLDDNWRSLIGFMDLNKEAESKPKQDDFDRALKEMVFEPRGTVTDKLKSEEKLLKKEKARLERLEQERLDRMKGLTEEEKKAKHRSADDLDDGYFLEPISRFDKNNKTLAYDGEGKSNRDGDDSDEELERLIQENTRANGQTSTDESESDDESGDDDGEEEHGSEEENQNEEDEDHFSDLVYDSDSDHEKSNTSKLKKKSPKSNETINNGTVRKRLTEEDRKAMMEKAAKELPYTFVLPHKYEALEKLLKNRNAEYQEVILDRMIKCNHPKVEATNKEKMITLFAYLLQHINDTAAGATITNVEGCFSVLDRICPLLYDLSHLNPAETTQCFREVIKEKQAEFRNQEKEYPSLETLVFFKIASQLYSASDFRHFVVTPCVIFISHILSRCKVANRTDIASGLFLVTTLLDYTQLSKRFLPAAINFLVGVIYLCVPKRPVQQLKVIPPFKSTGDTSSLLVLLKKDVIKLQKSCDACVESTDLVRTDIDASFKVRALNTTLQLTTDLLETLSDNPAAKFLTEPIESILDKLDVDHYPNFVKTSFQKCQTVINSINDKNLSYIVPGIKRPKALRMMEPKFERIYDDKRNRKTGSKEKAIRDGMIRKIKKETKGAVREIRRDNAFLSKLQFKRQMHSDAERKEKVKRIFAEASIQQGELNAMDRKKKHL